jgi:4-amino-4-deoxy-L-arabinose transferase-like glycosyltransferase
LTVAAQSIPPTEQVPPPRRAGSYLPLAALLVGAAAALLAGIGTGAVDRSQEARVLETAREMLGAPGRRWLVPEVNGHVRLQKPPLAYWLSAVAFELAGVGEGRGRVPFALVGVATVALTYAGARWLFTPRAALLAAAALLGSELFFRHSRLAETDGPAALFVTAAVLALWRGFERFGTGGTRAAVLWFNLASLAMALAALTKGPPALYPLLFFVALAAVERRWNALAWWALGGAPLVLAAVAAPWFVYVYYQPDFRQIVGDLENSAAGGQGHKEWFFVYFPQLLVATLPWTGFVIAGIVDAAGRWRLDWRTRGLLLWSASILLPLCLWGNKQIHYLLPLMPPLMILAGGWIDRALSAPAQTPESKAARYVLLGTLAGCAVAAGAPAVAGYRQRGHVTALDVALSVTVLTIAVAGLLAYRSRGPAPATAVSAAGAPVALAVALGWWFPSLQPASPRTVAGAIRDEFGGGPYAFYGGETLPLVFHLRSILPVIRDEAELAEALRRDPNLVVVEPRRRQLQDPAAVGLKERKTFRIGEGAIRVYTAAARAARP